MDSLMDYVQWMDDFPITATGFRDADALVLCALSYFDLSPVFSAQSLSPAVTDCLPFLEKGKLKVMITGGTESYIALFKLAAASRRFGALHMSDYSDIRRQNPPLQFSAVCFHDDAGLSFLAYRGTDNSLSGWKEDFMISFTRTEAQWLALRYAEEHVTPDGRAWYIFGHSKGANLALYASCLLTETKREAIRRVYLFDGPGFCPEVLDLELIDRIRDRTTQLLPSFCVVGKLFALSIPDTRIVSSSATGLLQHGIITWGIDHGKPALSPAHDPVSLIINEALDNWVTNIPQENRKPFIDELFEALTASGAETLDQIQAAGLEGLEPMYRRLSEFSPLTRRLLSDLPKYALKAQMDDLRKKFSTELENRLKR